MPLLVAHSLQPLNPFLVILVLLRPPRTTMSESNHILLIQITLMPLHVVCEVL